MLYRDIQRLKPAVAVYPAPKAVSIIVFAWYDALIPTQTHFITARPDKTGVSDMAAASQPASQLGMIQV